MKMRSGQLCTMLVFATIAISCGGEEPQQSGGSGGSTGAGGSGTGGTAGGGSGSGGTTGGGTTGTGDFFPFALGNSWEYDVTEVGQPSQKKVNKIVRMEAVGGTGPDKNKVAFRVETTKVMTPGSPPGDATISWQTREGARVVRYREESCAVASVVVENGTVKSCNKNEDTTWSPARIRIDENPMGAALAKDMMWPETFTETKTTFRTAGQPGVTATMSLTQSWKVLDINANATSPAGNFSGCLVLQKTSASDLPKRYTFCRGVGKVREEGTGQVEVLSKYVVVK